MKRQNALFLIVLLIFPILAPPTMAIAASDKSIVAENIYDDPLTFRETPIGFRENPIQWTNEPRGFRDNPIQWRSTPIGFRETPIPQLQEPRNGRESPPRFVERDSIIVSNTNPRFLRPSEDHLQINTRDGVYRIETTNEESTRIVDNFSERNPGFQGVNPPSKARLRDFQ